MGNQQLPCSKMCLQTCQLPPADGCFLQKTNIVKNEDSNKQNFSYIKSNLQEGQYPIQPQKSSKTLGVNKSSIRKKSQIDLQGIYIIPQGPSLLRKIQSQVMDVPFDVVILSISQKLNHVIKSFGKQLIQKYQKKEFSQKWKLHKKGFYINYLANHLYAIFSPNFYFQGELIQQQGCFLPVNRGVLISQEGIYSGSFLNGKAHGKGYFNEINHKTIYRGQWEQGEMKQGIIENEQFKFEGCFKDKLPYGKGNIYFKKSRHIYSGIFENGLYNDENGLLKCDKYIYRGEFINGFKYGYGCLTQKQTYGNSKKTKTYHPSGQFKGSWHKDSFLGKKRYVDTLEMIFKQS